MAQDLRGQIGWLIAVRAMISTLLLGGATLAQITAPGSFALHPFFWLIAFTYALTIVYAATVRLVPRHRWIIDAQLACDAVVVSAFIFLTGGALDVGGQRNFAERIQFGQNIFRAGEAHAAVAFGVFFLHERAHVGRFARAVEELNFRSGSHALAGTQQGPPFIRRDFFHEQQLDLAAARGLASAQARAEHAGVVEHEQVEVGVDEAFPSLRGGPDNRLTGDVEGRGEGADRDDRAEGLFAAQSFVGADARRELRGGGREPRVHVLAEPRIDLRLERRRRRLARCRSRPAP